jgi:hypothetical protein
MLLSLLLAPLPPVLTMVAAAVPPRAAPATTPPARLERRDQVTLGATFQGYTLVTSGDTTICAFCRLLEVWADAAKRAIALLL